MNKRTSLITFSIPALCVTLLCTSCGSTGISGTSSSSGRKGEVYLFRGLANVFSTGMDGIGQELKRNGVNATVYNHTAWRPVAESIIQRSKRKYGVSYPIIIMGHSFGADASLSMANYLGNNGVKVAYVAAFDPSQAGSIGPNVASVENYHLSSNGNKDVRKAPNFNGRITNIDVSQTAYSGVNHFNVEKDKRIQQKVIQRTLSLTR